MFTVYVIKDQDGNIYKGMKNNLARRFKEHKSGGTKTTAKMRGMKVVYAERFYNFADARKRELYFKTGAGRRFLKNVIP